MITLLKPVTPAESKAIKTSLIRLGVSCRVQIKKGTMYIYHTDVVGSFTKEQKYIIREVLKVGNFVSICGHSVGDLENYHHKKLVRFL
jgi:hypothetical protein